jgi:ribosome maturation factor RimP
MPTSDPLTTEVSALVTAALAPANLVLDAIAIRPMGRTKLVTVIVDSDSGIDLDEVAAASRLVSATLDEEDGELGRLFGGPYTLEVSSPGLDRPLTAPRHWLRARARLVAVTLQDGSARLVRVGSSDAVGATVLENGKISQLNYADVTKAVIEVEFKPAPAADLAKLGIQTTEQEQSE